MSDWEDQLDEIEKQEEVVNTKNDEIADWEKEVDNIQTNLNSNSIAKKEDEEIEEIVKPKIDELISKPKPKEHTIKEDEYEKKWQAKNKSKIEREKVLLLAMEGLDEETKKEKLMELQKLIDAEELLGDSDKQNAKSLNFDHKTVKLEIEKDFTDLGINVSGKLKAMKKPNLILSFLKKVNTTISNNFDTEMINDLLQHIQVIQNKKKNEKKDKNKKSSVSTQSKILQVSSKKMTFDAEIESTEINPSTLR